MEHYLKILPKYYKQVKNGSKTFEVRVNDRNFKKNDKVVLQEFDDKINTYFGTENLIFRIGYVFPLDDERVVFSLIPLEPSKAMRDSRVHISTAYLVGTCLECGRPTLGDLRSGKDNQDPDTGYVGVGMSCTRCYSVMELELDPILTPKNDF